MNFSQDQQTPAKSHLTLRAVIVSLIVAAMTGAAYPYIVLKIGYGPNISLVSAFFGFMALASLSAITHKKHHRCEVNLVQTAGTAAGQSGFMCAVLAAFDMLKQKPELGFNIELSTFQIFIWLSLTGMLGVLLAVPLRQHYIDEENLPFADGAAAGETIKVLDEGPEKAKPRLYALSFGMMLSALVTFLRDGLSQPLLPPHIAFNKTLESLKLGSEVSLLSIGSGLIVGLRVGLSMAIGMIIAWVIAPPLLVQSHIVPALQFSQVLRWVMWPAVGFLVSGGLTALILKWKLVIKTFTQIKTNQIGQKDISMRFLIIGASILAILIALQHQLFLDFPVWLTIISLILSFVLMLIGTRVLGETNWAPISSMANVMQLIYHGLAPHSITANMIGSGMSASVAANGEHLMQDYKAGKIVGSINRDLTIMQLMAVPVGSLAVAIIYPALKLKYGIGEQGLTSPISLRWAGFAELLSKGLSSLPPGCLVAMIVAVLCGTLMTLLEPRYARYVPSPTAIGIGMLVPGQAILPMVIGGLIQHVWHKKNKAQEEAYNLPLSSGFIAGEAIIVLILAILALIKN